MLTFLLTRRVYKHHLYRRRRRHKTKLKRRNFWCSEFEEQYEEYWLHYYSHRACWSPPHHGSSGEFLLGQTTCQMLWRRGTVVKGCVQFTYTIGCFYSALWFICFYLCGTNIFPRKFIFMGERKYFIDKQTIQVNNILLLNNAPSYIVILLSMDCASQRHDLKVFLW